MIQLNEPYAEDQIRALKMGDMVHLTGVIYTGRDAVHKFLHEGGTPPVNLAGQIIYHCGPVVIKEKGRWAVKAAGPTTSIREEPYQAHLIEKYALRAVIGKGGMGPKTLEAAPSSGASTSTRSEGRHKSWPNASPTFWGCTWKSSEAPRPSGRFA
jgi:fumarate hydratase class I